MAGADAQTPDLHVSCPLQSFPSEQLEPSGAEKAPERIAASFDDFVAQLRVLSREDLGPSRVISVEIDPEFLKMVREQEAQEDSLPTLRWPKETAEP